MSCDVVRVSRLVAALVVVALIGAGCAGTGKSEGTALGSSVGSVVGSSVGGKHAWLGSQVGGMVDRQSGAAVGDSIDKGATPASARE